MYVFKSSSNGLHTKEEDLEGSELVEAGGSGYQKQASKQASIHTELTGNRIWGHASAEVTERPRSQKAWKHGAKVSELGHMLGVSGH